MQHILSKGRNVEEAVDLGLRLMNTSKDDVNIEIVNHGKERFWKVFSTEAVVKLTKHKKREEDVSDFESLINEFFETDEKKNSKVHQNEERQEITIDTLEGKVWVKHGEIHCGASKDSFPTIKIPEQITVLVNGEIFQGKSLVVSDKEKYELISDVVEKEMTWKITMAPDKLKVYLHVDPGYKIDYTIVDVDPNQHIELTVVKNRQVNNGLKFEEVVEKMGLMGTKHGFKQFEIMKAMEAIEPGVFVVAEGKPAVQGKHGWLESKVNTKVEVGLKEKEDGRVDFREIKTIPYVEKGKVIGIIHPPVAGEIGYTVTNDPIPAKQSLPLKVLAEKGIAVIGDKIVATETGRPQIEQRGHLIKASIIQKLTHIGNVDLSSGNITFKGDVEVFGEVADQMSVEAVGEVEIHKAVNNATITSSRGVTLHSNSNGSKITAGHLDFFEAELSTQLESIIETVDKIIAVLEKVTGSEMFKNSEHIRGSIQPLIRLLIEKKFADFPQTLKKFVNSISKADLPTEDETWRKVGDSLSQLFLSLSIETIFHESLQKLSNDMKALVEQNSESIYENVFITTPNAMNSKLYSSGDISITGKGCINTEVQAGGYVQINGILRGGEVYGGLGVTVGEAGSHSSSTTLIAVPYDQSIRIDKAMEGVILKVGQHVHRFTNTTFEVHARVNQKDQLIVRS